MTELELIALQAEFSQKKKIMEVLCKIGDEKSAYQIAYTMRMMVYEIKDEKSTLKYSLNDTKKIGWNDLKERCNELLKKATTSHNNQDSFLRGFTALSSSDNAEITLSDFEKLLGALISFNCQKRLHVCDHFPEIENNYFPKDVMYLKIERTDTTRHHPEQKIYTLKYRICELAEEQSMEVSERIFEDLQKPERVNSPNQTFSEEIYELFQEKLSLILPRKTESQLGGQKKALEQGLTDFERTYTDEKEVSSEEKEKVKSSVKKLQYLIEENFQTQLVNVPSDGHCLFWSVALGLLIPKLDDSSLFESMYQSLFGDDINQIEAVKCQLMAYQCKALRAIEGDPLETLVCKIFRERVVDYMENTLDSDTKSAIAKEYQESFTWDIYAHSMRTTNAWCGEAELRAIECLADVKIFVENYNGYQSESTSEKTLYLKLVNGNHFQFYLGKEMYEQQIKHQLPQREYFNVSENNAMLDEIKLQAHLDEFQECNSTNEQISIELKTRINNIQEIYKHSAINQTLFLEDKPDLPISQWQAKDIQAWALHVKSQFKEHKPNLDEIDEFIAVIDRANYIVTYQIEHEKEPKYVGHRLRDTQLLSLLLMLDAKPEKGRLLQVKTGQGKTTITAAMAVIKALQGESVDIITSSPILAARDAEEKQAFYNLFGFIVANNNHDPNYLSGRRECYEANIVYGSVESFQFDLLNHEYNDLETRGKREFAKTTAIVDEVDSMLLDNGGHVAKLSTPMPGMEALQPFYMKIWRLLQDKEETFIAQLAEQEFTEEEIKTGIYKTTLEQFFSDKEKETLADQVKIWIDANNPPLPTFLQNHAKNQAETWVRHAFKAKYELQDEIDYRLIKNDEEKDVVVPIDFANTGITQTNTLWSDGLHQFLQLKHHVELTTESPTTAFISNVDYFLRYTYGKVLGMSGTLGGSQEQSLLNKVYHLDCLCVPTYETSQLEKLPILFSDSHDDWIKQSVNQACQVIERGQAVLLLCETRQDALEFEKLLQKKSSSYENIKIKTYIDEEDVDVAEEIVEPGTIVIATNLAGRGTDLKTEKAVDDRGGLCVLETFFAANHRVQEQADGRTARQGKPGQVGLILEKQRTMRALGLDEHVWEEIKTYSNPIDRLNPIREEHENVRLHDIENTELPRLRVQDALFKEYNKLCHALKKQQDEKRKHNQSDETFHIKLRALEDRFGFWLILPETEKMIKTIKLNEDGTVPDTKIVECFQSFNQDIVGAFNNVTRDNDLPHDLDECVIQNPIYYTQIGIYWLKVRNFDKAKQAFEKSQQILGEDSLFNVANDYHLASIPVEKNKAIEKKLVACVGSILPFLRSILEDSTQEHDRYKETSKAYMNKTYKHLDKHIKQVRMSLDTLFWQGIILVEGRPRETHKDAVLQGNAYLLVKQGNDYSLGFCNEQSEYQEQPLSDNSIIHSSDPSTIKINETLRQTLETIIVDKKGFRAHELMLLQPTELAKGFRTQLSMFELFKAQVEEQQKFCREHEDTEWVIRSGSSVATHDSLIELGLSKEDVESMSKNRLHEFASLGLGQIYQLGQVHGIDEKVKTGVIAQIYGALGVLAIGGVAAFFTAGQALYYAMSIAGVMISEALTDLVTELLLTREEAMSTEEYAIGKAITYGGALLGAGLTQLFKTPMMLQKAISGCQKLTAKLNRTQGVFKGIAGRSAGLLKRAEGTLATRLNSLKKATELEKDIARLSREKNKLEKTAAKLRQNNQMNKADKFANKAKKLEGNRVHYNKALAKKQHRLTGAQVAKQISKETGLDVAMTAISMKVLEPGLTELLDNLKPVIEKAVLEKIQNDSELRTQLSFVLQNDAEQKATKILEDSLASQIGDACKKISLSLITRARSIKLKLLATALDFTIAGSQCATTTEEFCKELKEQLSTASDSSVLEITDSTVEQKLQALSQLVSNKIIGQLTSPITKALSTHFVGLLVSRRLFSKKLAMNDHPVKKSVSSTEASRVISKQVGHNAPAVDQLRMFNPRRAHRRALLKKDQPQKTIKPMTPFTKVHNLPVAADRFYDWAGKKRGVAIDLHVKGPSKQQKTLLLGDRNSKERIEIDCQLRRNNIGHCEANHPKVKQRSIGSNNCVPIALDAAQERRPNFHTITNAKAAFFKSHPTLPKTGRLWCGSKMKKMEKRCPSGKGHARLSEGHDSREKSELGQQLDEHMQSRGIECYPSRACPDDGIATSLNPELREEKEKHIKEEIKRRYSIDTAALNQEPHKANRPRADSNCPKILRPANHQFEDGTKVIRAVLPSVDGVGASSNDGSTVQQRVAGEVKNPCVNCEQRGNAIVQEPNGSIRIQRDPLGQGSAENSDTNSKSVPIGPGRGRASSMLSLNEDRRMNRIEREVPSAVVDVGRAAVNDAIKVNSILGAESVAAASVVIPPYPRSRRASDGGLGVESASRDKEIAAINQAKEVHENKDKATVGFSGAFTNNVSVTKSESGVSKDQVKATRPARKEEIYTDILRPEGKAGPLRPRAQEISETQQKRPGQNPASQFNCAEVPASLQADRLPVQDRVTVAFEIKTNTQREESKLASNPASHFSQMSSAEKQSKSPAFARWSLTYR